MVSTHKVSLWFAYLVASMLLVFSLPAISPGKGLGIVVGGGVAYGFMNYLLQWVQSCLMTQKS